MGLRALLNGCVSRGDAFSLPLDWGWHNMTRLTQWGGPHLGPGSLRIRELEAPKERKRTRGASCSPDRPQNNEHNVNRKGKHSRQNKKADSRRQRGRSLSARVWLTAESMRRENYLERVSCHHSWGVLSAIADHQSDHIKPVSITNSTDK